MGKTKNTIQEEKATIQAVEGATEEVFLRSGDEVNLVVDEDTPGDAIVSTTTFEVRYPGETANEYHAIDPTIANQGTKLALIRADGFYRLRVSAYTSGDIKLQIRGR